MLSLRFMARLSGISLLLMALVAGVGYGYAYPQLCPSGHEVINPVAYRIFLFAFLLVLVLDVLVAWAMRYYFQAVHIQLSALQYVLRLVYVSFLGMALAGVVFSASLPLGEMERVAIGLMWFEKVWGMGLVVFSLHLFVLAALFWLHQGAPRILAWLLFVAAACYLLTSLAGLFYAEYPLYKARIEAWLAMPMAAGELGIAIWLLSRKAVAGD